MTSTEHTSPRPPECGHDDPNEHVSCPTCWWDLTHDVDEDGTVTDLLEQM